MKTLQIRRHSDKTGEHISQEGFERLAGLIVDADKITDLFCGSDIMRTAETALAAMVYGGVRPERLHTANSGLGNAKQLELLIKSGFISARKSLGDNLAAARQCLARDDHERTDDYGDMSRELLATVVALMDELPEQCYGLVFGHSPFIEMIAEVAGLQVEKEFGSCEGIVITYDGWTQDALYVYPILTCKIIK